MRSGRLGCGTAGLDGPRSKNQLFSGASLLCALGERRNAQTPKIFQRSWTMHYRTSLRTYG